jgi:hypothetical protein
MAIKSAYSPDMRTGGCLSTSSCKTFLQIFRSRCSVLVRGTILSRGSHKQMLFRLRRCALYRRPGLSRPCAEYCAMWREERVNMLQLPSGRIYSIFCVTATFFMSTMRQPGENTNQSLYRFSPVQHPPHAHAHSQSVRWQMCPLTAAIFAVSKQVKSVGAAGEQKRCTRRVPDESPRDVVSWASSGRNLETVWEVGSGQDFKRPGEWPVSVCKKG